MNTAKGLRLAAICSFAVMLASGVALILIHGDWQDLVNATLFLTATGGAVVGVICFLAAADK